MNEEQLKQLIEKWEGQLAIWRGVIDNPIFHTKEDQKKASHHCLVICSFLCDLKEINERFPTTKNN